LFLILEPVLGYASDAKRRLDRSRQLCQDATPLTRECKKNIPRRQWSLAAVEEGQFQATQVVEKQALCETALAK
jgi:hypothetical protein